MRIADIAKGDFLTSWYDKGAGMGGEIVAWEVLKVGKSRVFVRDDMGREGWRRPESFDGRTTAERYRTLVEENRARLPSPAP